MATSGRRALSYRSLDEIRTDVRLLVDSPHRTVGKWTLPQILSHLCLAFTGSVDGFPGPVAPWFVRLTIGNIARWSMLGPRYIPEGAPLPKKLHPPLDLDLQKEWKRLLDCMDRFEKATQFPAHPLLGKMTRDQWHVYHQVHCAHHLSFVVLD